MAKRPSEPRVEIAERTLPHNLEAERAVLGAILTRNEVFESVTKQVTEGSFFRTAHQFIYRAIVDALDRPGGSVDLITVKEWLSRKGLLDECGGPAYIGALVDGIPVSINATHYAAIVKETATYRHLIAVGGKILSEAYNAEEPTGVLIANIERQLMDVQTEGGATAPLSASTSDLMTNMEWRTQHRGELTGFDTGFKDINDITMGWQPADVIILAARPSIGKTTFAINTLVATARWILAQGRPEWCAVFSMEMKRQQLEYRMLSAISGVPLTRILNGNVFDSEWGVLSQAISEMATLPIIIDDSPSHTAQSIRSACRRIRRERGAIGLAVLDYIQLTAGSLDRRGATRNEQLTDTSRRLKVDVAGELNLPLMVLSQLSRAGESRPPLISDLRDSGALEQDADLIAFLHRKNHREGGHTLFILEKQRNGPTGTLNLTLDQDITLFKTLEGAPPAPTPPTPEETAEAKRKVFQRRTRRT